MLSLSPGVYAPVPTPFTDRGDVDVPCLTRALGRWAVSPLTGFVVLGSNGEAPLVDEDESDRVIGAAREALPPGRLLVAGTGRESTRAAVQAAVRAARLGADAVIVRTPGFFKAQMTSEAFVRHYTAVADASPVPILLYNFTAVTGVNIGADAVARLAGHPNIAGLKESGGDVAQIADFVEAGGPSFLVLAGSSTSFHPSLCAGARGGILALACVLPDACVRLFEQVGAGRHDEAAALQRQLVPMARLLSRFGVAGMKAALDLIGCGVGDPRPPLAPVNDEGRQALRQALAAFEQASPAVR
jgi:4-hydroxy-2-oxoglutarate aldolase